MSADHDHDIKSHVRTYMMIGGALVIGTIITVAVSYVDFGSHTMNIAVGLLIATVKASLVALFFMHLISEKTAIYLFLASSFFFFAGMMGLILWNNYDPPNQTIDLQAVHSEHDHNGEGDHHPEKEGEKDHEGDNDNDH